MICDPVILSHVSSQSGLIGINHTNEEENNVKYVTVSKFWKHKKHGLVHWM